MIFHTWSYNLCTRVFPFVARMSCTNIWMLKLTCHGMIIVHINTFLCQTLWSVRPLSCIQWCFNSPWNMNMVNSFSGTSPFLQIPINIFVWNPQSLVEISLSRDDVIKWKHFPRYWPFFAGYSLVTGEFPAQRPVTRSFDAFFDLRLNKWLSKQWWGWWFDTLWRHCIEGINPIISSYALLTLCAVKHTCDRLKTGGVKSDFVPCVLPGKGKWWRLNAFGKTVFVSLERSWKHFTVLQNDMEKDVAYNVSLSGEKPGLLVLLDASFSVGKACRWQR